jgi:hypothetical protein
VLAKLKAISKRMGQALGRIGWYHKHHLRYYSNELGKDYEHQTPPPQNFHTHNQFQHPSWTTIQRIPKNPPYTSFNYSSQEFTKVATFSNGSQTD